MKVGDLVIYRANNGHKYFGIVKRYRQWDSQIKVLWFEEGKCLWTNGKHLEVICEGR